MPELEGTNRLDGILLKPQRRSVHNQLKCATSAAERAHSDDLRFWLKGWLFLTVNRA